MTRRVGDVIIIEPEEPEPCARCGRVKETRPAGPNGERICFACATPAEFRAYARRLFGGPDPEPLCGEPFKDCEHVCVRTRDHGGDHLCRVADCVNETRRNRNPRTSD